MGKFLIIIIMASIIGLYPVFYVATNQKSTSVDRIAQSATITNLQNAASCYANMVMYKLDEDLNNGTFNLTNFNYTESSSVFNNTNVAVVTNQIDSETFKITISAQEGPVTATAEVMNQQVPFSYHAMFLNTFDDNLCFGNGEGVDGPFHINGNLGVGQVPGPEFLGTVTLTGHVNYWLGATQANFMGFMGDSVEEGADHITLPNHMSFVDKVGSYQLDNVFSFATDGELYIDLTTDVNGDQIVRVYGCPYDDPDLSTQTYWDSLVVDIPIATFNAFGSTLYTANNDIYIRGTLDGAISFCTEDDIYIAGSILYENDPRDDPTSDDALGLICGNNVYVATRELEFTPGVYYNENDVWVMAAIFTEGSLKVEDLFSWQGPRQRGTYYTYGSRVQQSVSATWDGSANYRGYKEKIIYDTRFRRMKPPSIPLTTNRKIYNWKESITIS